MCDNKFRGMGVAFITPFKDDESVDFEAIENLLNFQIENGADFIVTLATSAETPTLSKQENENVLKFVIEKVNKRVPIVLGLGNNNTKALVSEIQSRSFDGVDAILSVAPYYNKPNQEGLYKHFSLIAEASPVPIIIYNVPGRTGVNIKPETTLKLANNYSNIVAIKEASGNLNQINELIIKKPKSFKILSGDDALTYSILALGGDGVISVIGNAYPKEFSNMVHLCIQGHFTEALNIHRRFTDLFDLLFVDGNPAGIKAVLYIKGLIKNVLRAPLVPVSDKTFDSIKTFLKR